MCIRDRNTPGPDLAEIAGVHAMTDVTGFGLAGHALEMARGSGAGVQIDWQAVPLIEGARDLAEGGFITGASGRNWASYGEGVVLADGLTATDRALLTDPQTSGGLMVACDPSVLDQVLAVFAAHGFDRAGVIGRVTASDQPSVQVA